MTLSRRRFLGGAACLVALPVLESLTPRPARAQALQAPRRLVIYYVPNGRNMDTFRPKNAGVNFDLPTALAPLAPLRNDLTMISGLTSIASEQSDTCDHAKAAGPVLTSIALKNGANVLHNGISVDQQIVRSLNVQTPFPSLQWTAAQPGVNDCGALSTYTQTISWADASTPLSPLATPGAAFDQLFAGTDAGATEAERAARRARQQSVLDFVQNDAKGLATRLNRSDKAKLDEYFTGVRELELRLTRPTIPTCTPGSKPSATLDHPSTVRAFNDLMVLALRCDMTRVISFMLEFELSYRVYDFLFPGQSSDGHHALSHHSNDTQLQQLIKVETWETQQVLDLAQKLKAIPEGAGSMLDNTALVLLPGMGLGAAHDHTDISVAVLGRCGGTIKPGSHLLFKGEPIGNLHVSLLQSMGVPAKTFGMDGVAPLKGLSG